MLKIKIIGDVLQVAEHPVSKQETILSALSGLGDYVVILLTNTQIFSTLQDAQYTFVMHESQFELLNSEV